MRFGVVAEGPENARRVALFADGAVHVDRSGERLPHSMDAVFRIRVDDLRDRVQRIAKDELERLDSGFRVLAPVGERQEVWASGVTYERSRDARVSESSQRSVYDLVYDAERPELFFKALPHRVAGPEEAVGIRADSDWNVPEPELVLAIDAHAEILGYTLGNDMSSRSIEGANPLYLPQAKVYERSCAIGPAILPIWEAPPLEEMQIRLRIERDGRPVFEEQTALGRIRRSVEELVTYLFRALEFPSGALLLTGTGIVPPEDFTLVDGDEVVVACDPIGELRNVVTTIGSGSPLAGERRAR